MKFHDERVTIRNNVWFDQYTQKGGDAVDFFRYFYGESEEQAAAVLLELFRGRPGEACPPAPRRTGHVPSKERAETVMAGSCRPHGKDMRRVFAYLCQTRGIAPGGGVRLCPRKGLLYEERRPPQRRLCGPGRARRGPPSSTPGGPSPAPHFRQTLPGSEKAYSFHWQGTSRKLYAFEAPIDMLSYISLHPEGWQNHTYVAVCGVSAAPIHHFLETQPQLGEVTLCLDNDEAGHNAARRIAAELLNKWNTAVSAEFPSQKGLER